MKDNIAICFYGLTRSLKYTYKSIKKKIIDLLENNDYQITIYLHTYDLKILNNDRSDEKECLLDINEYKLLNPDIYKITNQNDFDKMIDINKYLNHGDPWDGQEKKSHASLKNILRQWNSLQEVTKLWESSLEKHKCIIYLRPDLFYINKINLENISLCLNSKQDKPLVFIPGWAGYGGHNDRFAYGNSSAMKIYGNRIQNAAHFSLNRNLHSEQFLKYVLRKNKVSVKYIGMYAVRIRADGHAHRKDKKDIRKHCSDQDDYDKTINWFEKCISIKTT